MTGRTQIEEAVRLTDFSASRLALAARCGLAFKYHYVDKLPAPYDRSALLLGDVVHNGVQEWYELPDDGYATTPLEPILRAQWEKLLPTPVWQALESLLTLEAECEAMEAAIRFKRPEIKAPRQTKAYVESDAAKEFAACRMAVVEICDMLPEIKWNKNEDPYAAYQKSMEMARAMMARWQRLPPPLFVERPFAIEIAGFRVRGRIDQIRQDPTPNGEVMEPTIVDMKTGTQVMTQMEAFLQSFIYSCASKQDPEMPDCDRVAFYLNRKDKYQQGRIDGRRHLELASRIMRGRARDIESGAFEPSAGFWCKSCDFSDLCSAEISLWSPGGDGLTAELLP